MNRPLKQPEAAAGAALFTTLVILLILTILGVSSVQTTIMQERLARNYLDLAIAFQAAEAAATEAENLLEAMPDLSAFPAEGAAQPCNAGLCTSLDGLARWQAEQGAVDWDDASTHIEASVAAAALGAESPPRYLIEYVATASPELGTPNISNVGEAGRPAPIHYFRITARGTGASPRAVVMLQTTYGRRFR